jgi:hypothetical protein
MVTVFLEPPSGAEVKLKGDEVVEFVKLPELQRVMRKLLRWGEETDPNSRMLRFAQNFRGNVHVAMI